MSNPVSADSAPVPARWKRNVSIFLTGQTVSMLGSMIVQYAVMWYVTLETRSGLAIALYAVAAFLPQGIVSVFGGTFADRVNRRVLVMVSDGGIAAVTLVLAFLMANGVTDLWIVLLAVAVRSVGAGVQQPAVAAMIPQITPADQLMRVNGIFGTIQSAMMLIAPAAAGVVFGLFGIVPVFFIDVVTAVIGIGMLALVAVPTLAEVAAKTTTYREDLVEGARYIWQHRIVRWLLLVFAIIFVFTIGPSFLTPLMVARSFGGEVWKLTAVEFSLSVGMVIGGVVMSTLLTKKSPMMLILVSTFGFAVLSVAMGLSPNLWVLCAVFFLFGLLIPPFSTPFMTLIQQTVPPERHGRVFSYVGIVMALATPIGMTVFGPLADRLSVQALLVIAGIATAAVAVIAVLVPSGRAAIAAARESHRQAVDEVEPADASSEPG